MGFSNLRIPLFEFTRRLAQYGTLLGDDYYEGDDLFMHEANGSYEKMSL